MKFKAYFTRTEKYIEERVIDAPSMDEAEEIAEKMLESGQIEFTGDIEYGDEEVTNIEESDDQENTQSAPTSIKCTVETARFTGNAYHRVEWIDSHGEWQSQHIHGCENDEEAVNEVLGEEGLVAYLDNK